MSKYSDVEEIKEEKTPEVILVVEEEAAKPQSVPQVIIDGADTRKV